MKTIGVVSRLARKMVGVASGLAWNWPAWIQTLPED